MRTIKKSGVIHLAPNPHKKGGPPLPTQAIKRDGEQDFDWKTDPSLLKLHKNGATKKKSR